MSAAGAYHLDLSCDDPRHQGDAVFFLSREPYNIETPTQFIEATKRTAQKRARVNGWLLRGNTCICPIHAGHRMHSRQSRSRRALEDGSVRPPVAPTDQEDVG